MRGWRSSLRWPSSAAAAAAAAALACRVGIATGLVVVGDLVGEGAAQEEAVVGDTPNLAARLQGVAEPGQVVVAEGTRRLLGDLFVLRALTPKALKGIGAAVAAFAVLGERAVASRFEARSGSLQPIVGRDQELALLLERWAQARAGEGQAVLLVGEAGVGKSRISRALQDALAEESHVLIRYQCSPYHAGSALWPVIQQLEHAARFASGDSQDARLDRFEALFDDANGEDRALLARLLGLDGSARYGTIELAPTQLRARTLAVLARQLQALAATQPVLVLLEDVHWIDPTTLELVERWLDEAAAARVLLLVTSRPDQQPALAAHPHVTRLSLNRLSRTGVAAIVARLGGARLAPATIDTIIARTDGVPLYVEELTKAILETGASAVPASLHDSLMAQLDRLPEVKEVAQVAACIGREFDYRLLAAAAPQTEAVVQAALERLIAAELVFRRGTPPDASYTFKHALVRDAAYESLLRAKRQVLHRRILDALAATAALPQVLGYHAREAELTERAVDCYEQAGRAALHRPAYAEAIAHLRSAAELIRMLSEDPAWRERELELQIAIGQACLAAFGYGANETAAAYEQALELLRRSGESPLWFAVYYGNWVVRYVRAEHREALPLAQDLAERAARGADDGAEVVAHRILGTSHAMMGLTGEALRHLDRAIQLYDPVRHRGLIGQVGHDSGVAVLAYRSLALGQRGFLDQASEAAQAAVALARETRHPLTLAYAMGHANILWLMLGDTVRARAVAEENLAYTEANGIRIWHVFTLGWLVVLHSSSGQHAQALAAAEQVRPLFAATGTGLFLPFVATGELRSLQVLGRLDDCERRLAEVQAQIAASAEHWIEADIHRIAGDLRLAQGDRPAAAACYRRAIDLAAAQEARLFELRAATSLARLVTQDGARQEALAVLAPIHAWFTEGFATPDLIEAKALLEELG